MISIKELRKNTSIQKFFDEKREFNLENIIQIDSKIRAIKTSISSMRAQRNTASDSIGEAKKLGRDASKEILKTRQLGDKLKDQKQN